MVVRTPGCKTLGLIWSRIQQLRNNQSSSVLASLFFFLFPRNIGKSLHCRYIEGYITSPIPPAYRTLVLLYVYRWRIDRRDVLVATDFHHWWQTPNTMPNDFNRHWPSDDAVSWLSGMSPLSIPNACWHSPCPIKKCWQRWSNADVN